jgi:hypothetical protein
LLNEEAQRNPRSTLTHLWGVNSNANYPATENSASSASSDESKQTEATTISLHRSSVDNSRDDDADISEDEEGNESGLQEDDGDEEKEIPTPGWLDVLLGEIKEKMNPRNKEAKSFREEYARGEHLFIKAKYGPSSLKIINGKISHECFYVKDLLLWCPISLFPDLSFPCVEPSCKGILRLNGWPDNPSVRRVYSLGCSYSCCPETIVAQYVPRKSLSSVCNGQSAFKLYLFFGQ